MEATGEFWLNKKYSNPSGFTLFEVMVTIFILSLAVVPMMKSFRPAMMSSAGVAKTTVLTNQARGTLERLSAVDFNTLNICTSELSTDFFEDNLEKITFEGIDYDPKITITDAAGDSTLLKLTVTIETISFSTLRADY